MTKKPEVIRELFADAFQRGLSYTQITQLLKISRRTSQYWRVQMGLPARQAGRRKPNGN
jgi:transposase